MQKEKEGLECVSLEQEYAISFVGNNRKYPLLQLNDILNKIVNSSACCKGSHLNFRFKWTSYSGTEGLTGLSV